MVRRKIWMIAVVMLFLGIFQNRDTYAFNSCECTVGTIMIPKKVVENKNFCDRETEVATCNTDPAISVLGTECTCKNKEIIKKVEENKTGTNTGGNARCTENAISCVVTGGMCRNNGFNCDNYLNLGRTECEGRRGCYESVTCGLMDISNFCYLPIEEEITPNECGYVGKICCDGNTCPNGGIPTMTHSGVVCTCTNSGSDSGAAIGNSSYNPFCLNGTDINTALGCIPTTVGQFVPWLLKYLFGIAGGIAFLLMVYGFILIATSGGDEKKMAGAKETITSAIVGLLVCIFSIFILKLIAVNILQIPGF